jgi:hypothetical protein
MTYLADLSQKQIDDWFRKGAIPLPPGAPEYIVDWIFKLPNDMIQWVEPELSLVLFRKPIDNILEAVKSLIRMPHGCFEQTSATTYPMVMGLKVLR